MDGLGISTKHINTFYADHTMQTPYPFIVVAGPQSSGKTTTLLALRQQGYAVIWESALTLIRRVKHEGHKPEEYMRTHFREFQERLTQIQAHREDRMRRVFPPWPFYLCDRCDVDQLAYYTRAEITPPAHLDDGLLRARYSPTVFWMEMLPEEYWNKTKHGKPRTTTYEEGVELGRHLRHVYERIGFMLIEIPYGGRTEYVRAEDITGHLRSMRLLQTALDVTVRNLLS